MEISTEYKNHIAKALVAFVAILCVFFAVKVLAEFRGYRMMGSSESRTITVYGHGEVQAVPDIANVYLTISKDGKTVKDAQNSVAEVESKVLAFLAEKGIEAKDIKATDSSFSPKYEYKYDAKVLIPCNQYGCPPAGGRSVIVGYTANESITIKVRNADEVGAVMQGLGELGVTNLSGPAFAIDDEEALTLEARKKAIDDAQAEAKILAKDLGVRLGKVVSFSEGSGYGAPMLYKASMMDGAESTSLQVPRGENTVSSDVTITYEIK